MENNNEQNSVDGLTPELKAKLAQIEVDSNKTINKKDKKIGPLIAAIFVLLAISGAAIAFSLMKKDAKPSVSPNPTPVEAPNEPVVINVETTKANIDQRVDEINLINYDQYSNNKKGDSVISAGYIFRKNGEFFDNLGFTAKEKVYITAAVLEYHDEDALESVTKADYKSEAVQKYKDSITEKEFLERGKKIPAEKFAARYKEIFGEEIKHQTVNECGANAHYSADTGAYYFDFVGGCGGIDMRKIIIKKDEYKSTNDELYLDTTVTTVFDGQDENGKAVCAIFNGYYNIDSSAWNYDLKDSRVAKSCKGGETPAELGTLIETGTKYRYIFDKDYHFKKLERI